jgi:hypothetical protein
MSAYDLLKNHIYTNVNVHVTVDNYIQKSVAPEDDSMWSKHVVLDVD